MNKPRILIAGIGNIFLGDDGFGVEVAQRLAKRTLPDSVRVVDFGTRGFDLAYAFLDGYDTVIWVDAAPRGGHPGSLYVIEPDVRQILSEGSGLSIEPHRIDPVNVLRLVSMLGGSPGRLFLVGCEPTSIADQDDIHPGLSEPVSKAVEFAIELIEDLIEREIQGIAYRQPLAAVPACQGSEIQAS
jgi:hydrogenase maturation protease